MSGVGRTLRQLSPIGTVPGTRARGRIPAVGVRGARNDVSRGWGRRAAIVGQILDFEIN